MAVRPARRARHQFAAAFAFTALLATAIALGIRLRDGTTAPPVRLAEEAAIAADTPAELTVFRYAPNPSVLVLDFPSLTEQGRMLNRLAALSEKRGAPHDRVLDDPSLSAAIAASGETPETWYYGHDYSASEIARFFQLADAEAIALNPAERRLRTLVHAASAESVGFGALISLPAVDPTHAIDGSARATILHHELSHGDYFTQGAYASYAGAVWQTLLTEAERASMRRYLDHEGYDQTLPDLMINEAQAYLFFTLDARYFDPVRAGFPLGRLAKLRHQFATGLEASDAAAAMPRGLAGDVSRLSWRANQPPRITP